MEYYFHSKLGLLAIVPHPAVPSAVELRIRGIACGSYVSADHAARAVASGTTHCKELDNLPAEDRPLKLRAWGESLSFHFGT